MGTLRRTNLSRTVGPSARAIHREAINRRTRGAATFPATTARTEASNRREDRPTAGDGAAPTDSRLGK